ncbi:MAG: Ig-like domain-containing protein, partial [Gammaproteobacteria bacterium]
MKKHVFTGIASSMISLGVCATSTPFQPSGSYSGRAYSRQTTVADHRTLNPAQSRLVKNTLLEKSRSMRASLSGDELVNSALSMTSSHTNNVHDMALMRNTKSTKQLDAPDSEHLSLVQHSPVQQLVIIDHNVRNKHVLLQGIKPGVDVVEFNGNEDGLVQLKKALGRYQDLATLHIVSHGNDGVVYLGNSELTESTMRGEIDSLGAIDNALSDNADVLIYGCEVAKGEKGQDLLELISNKANVDIAASSNVSSGNAERGDWQLEVQRGNIESTLAFSDAALRLFDDVLAIDDAIGRTINTNGFSAGYSTTKSYDVDGSGYIFRVTTNSGNGSSLYSGFGYVVANLSGVIGGLNSVTVDLTGGESFDIDSMDIQSTTTRNYVFTPSTGSATTLSVSNASFATQTLNFSGITSFTITRQDGGDLEPIFMDNFVVKNASALSDSDGSLTAAGAVTEPVAINTTVDSVGEAIDVFDFSLNDAGSADGLSLDVSQIVINVSGTSSDTQRGNVTWRLDGPDATDVTGVYNGGSDTLTFSALSISVADGLSETYTVNAYYNDNTSLTEDLTYVLSVDGDTDLTVGGSGTQMGATSAVTNGSGSTANVTATQLAFTTQPAGSISGSVLSTQPVVAAQDAFGNTDTDFTETISLTEASAGTLTSGSRAAVSGVASFFALTYTATADQQRFTLTADDQAGVGSDLSTVDASAVVSDVVATMLVFDTQPAPLLVNSGISTSLTTVPVVAARDGNNVVDTGYSTDITLAEISGAGSATMTATGDTDGNGSTVTISPSSGVSTFTNMQLTYTASGGNSENFNLLGSSGGLTNSVSLQMTGFVPDSDGSLIAAGDVAEPVAINTIIDTVGEAVNVFDFTLTDGGASDGSSMSVSQVVVNVTGTATDTQRNNVTWRLNGPDVNNVTGTYSAGANTLTFSGLNISVANGGAEIYTINAYYSDNTGVTDNSTYIFNIDGDTDLTVGVGGTQMGSTAAVTNGAGGTFDVNATSLAFSTQPAGSISGSALTTQPVVMARDSFGNTDTDFVETVTVTEASAGSLTSSTATASAGAATFSSLTYTATADQQSFTLTANDDDGTGSDLPTVDANSVTSDVVATKLVFDTQPAPLSVNSGEATAFTTVPVVSAQDGNNVVDTGYSTDITLAEVNGAGSAVMSGTGDTDGSSSTVSLSPSSGVSTYTGLQLTYTASGGSSETFNLQASSGGLSTANSDQVTGVVDSTPPTVTDGNVSISGASGTGGAYIVGDTVTATWNNTSSGDNNSSSGNNNHDVSTVTVDFSQFGGGAAVSATNSSDTWTATYTLTEDGGGSIDAANRNVSVTATDGNANGATTSDTTNATVDNDSPVVSDGNISLSGASGSGGAFKVGDTATATWNNTAGGDNVGDVSVVQIDFSQLGGGVSTASNSSNTWTAAFLIDENGGGGIDAANLNVSVSATDDAGNTTNTSDTTNATLDNDSPVVSESTAVSTPTNDSSPNVTIFSTEAGSLAVGGACGSGSEGAIASGSNTITLTQPDNSTPLADGAYTDCTVSVTDDAGNTGSVSLTSFTVDTTNPSAPSALDLSAVSDTGSSETDNVTSDTTPTITGTAEASSTVVITSSIDGAVGSITAGSSGDWSITTPALSSGSHTLTATSTDAAGNTSAASSTLVISVDVTDPSTPSIPDLAASSDTGDSSTDNITVDTTPTFEGTADADATVSLISSIEGVVGSATAGSSGGWSITTSSLSIDSHSFTARATDAAGNTSAQSSGLTVVISNPVISLVSIPNTAMKVGDAVAVSIVASDAGFTLESGFINGVAVTGFGDDGGGSYSAVYTVSEGDTDRAAGDAIPVSFTLQDSAGNDTNTYTTQIVQNADSIDANSPGSATGTLAVNENAADGTRVGFVTATDSAGYSLTDDASGRFSVNSDSGEVSVADGTLLNFENDESHSVTVRVEDASSNVTDTVLTVTVNDVNDLPVATDNSASTNEDNAVMIDVLSNDSDEDGTLNVASVMLVSEPSSGSTSLNTGTGAITYTPDADANGTDSFTYTVFDNDGGQSNTATVTLTIAAQNDAPVAANDLVNTPEDTPVVINAAANDSDVDEGDSVIGSTLTLVSTPDDGDVSVDSGEFTYTPDENFFGTDTFTYTIKDQSNATSNVATVTVNVSGVNDSPTAVNDAATTDEDTSVTIDVTDNDSDIDGSLDSSTLSIVAQPSQGSVQVEGGQLVYTPDANLNGVDAFTYIVRDDGDASSNAATVNITINPVNDNPVARNDTATLLEDGTLMINVLGNDSDVESGFDAASVTLAITQAPENGSVNIESSGLITYTPEDLYNGNDSFSYTVTDVDGGTSNAALVSITVESVNNAPLANNDSFSTSEDVAVVVNPVVNDSDVDGTLNVSQLVIVEGPALGTLENNGDGTLTFTPDSDVNGSDRFSYTVADNEGATSEVATATIVIEPVNDDPTISGTPSGTATVGQVYTFVPTVTDIDSTGFTYVAENQPLWLSLDQATGALSGRPAAGDVGTYDSIVLTVSDSLGSATLATFGIEVQPDTDGDGTPDSVDLDDDDDGIPDTFEIANNLDPLDPVDALLDADSDGLNNVGEFEQGSDLFADDQPPVFGQAPAVDIDASGLLTSLPGDIAPTAIDAVDGEVQVRLLDDRLGFLPGRHMISWGATDAAGNSSETIQIINIYPKVSLAKDKLAVRGGDSSIRLVLNGEAPEYPFAVNYIISGSAQLDIDHTLESGSVTFESGVQALVPFAVLVDSTGSGGDSITVTLQQEGLNLGEKSTQVISLVSRNLAPKLSVGAEQGGLLTSVVSMDSGLVDLSLTIEDLNPGDTHEVVWMSSESLVLEAVDELNQRFDPALLDVGVYTINVSVTDSGEPVEVSNLQISLKVIAETPVLTTADTDGDGISDMDEGFGDKDSDYVPDYLDAVEIKSVLQQLVDVGDSFLIEVDPGIQLSLGEWALATDDFGASLSADEFTSLVDDEVIERDTIENVGGYFDFLVRDLEDRASAVNFVIPQLAAIPENAVYRKYNPASGWSNFIEDADNALASAPGEEGICPSPGSSEYQAGLTPGHWCVQLTIEDGGPNDTDGEANGTIVDPGGVGQEAPPA